MPFDIQTQFSQSYIHQEFLARCQQDTSLSGQVNLVKIASEYAYNRSKIIIRHMGEYTLHDIDHIYNVLKIMDLLLGKENISYLSTPELMMLILSAIFHDIGMAPSEKDVLAWKKVWDATPEFESAEEKLQYQLFERYLSARPDKTEQILTLTNNGESSKSDFLKNSLISDYIRSTHSFRAKEIIDKDWGGRIIYKETELTVEFAEVCFSHNQDASSIMNMDKQFLCGQGEYICFPLIAILLRISDLIDFDSKRTPEVLLSNLAIRNPISLTEWKKHRSIEAWNISPEIIQFQAKCRHPAIESAIHQFCDYIDAELIACNAILMELNRQSSSTQRPINIRIPFKVDRSKIETKKDIHGNPEYLYRETKFNLSKNQVIDLLMGTKLYGNPEVALRELLQNSIDACLLRQAMENKWNNPYVPEIHVRYFSENEDICLEVVDNGIGMDQSVIDNYYTNIGKSFYKSTEFYDLKASTQACFNPSNSRFTLLTSSKARY